LPPAAPRRSRAGVDIHVFAQAAFDQLAIFIDADLAGNVEDPVGFHRGNISRDRRGGFGKIDAEFG
jgi:hypothetical protein